MQEQSPVVFVIDDDTSVRESLSNLIGSAGHHVQTFASAQEFLSQKQAMGPSCLILDVQLPGLSGLDLQQHLTQVDGHLPIIFISGHSDIPMTVRAMKAGAIEFLTKPFRDVDLLNAVEQGIQRRHQMKQLKSQLAKVETFAPDHQLGKFSFSAIVGKSLALRRVLKEVETVAPTDSTVLVCGETGTGKELIARAIHNLSRRRLRPLVKLNCAAIPGSLLESELFGHERGAFTGAVAQRIGRFELANRGTIFLDEIGEIPLELQPKLLRVLQEREFERLGSTRVLHTDVRLIAATNAKLAERVSEKQFRSDLYYRLNVFPIVLPPLRERRDDIPILVQHFVQKFARLMNKRVDVIPETAMKALSQYSWPGNVRELENVIERSVILCCDSTLRPSLAELVGPNDSLQGHSDSPSTPSTTLKEVEREHIVRVLRESKWMIGGPKGAAARLGMKRTTLHSWLKRLGIARPC